MEFSLTAFKFGILFCLCICYSNLWFAALCALLKVRLLKFAIFIDLFQKHIFKKKIGNTEFILGWLFLGGYVYPLGWSLEAEDFFPLTPEEQQFALSRKPKFQQLVLKTSPYWTWLILLLLLIYLIQPANSLTTNFQMTVGYVTKAIQSMFGVVPKETFRTYSREMMESYRLLPFAVLISCILFASSTVISGVFRVQFETKKAFIKIITWMLLLLLLYFYFWKTPSFVFSFFDFRSILKYAVSALIGTYLTGFIAYFVIVMLARLRPARSRESSAPAFKGQADSWE